MEQQTTDSSPREWIDRFEARFSELRGQIEDIRGDGDLSEMRRDQLIDQTQAELNDLAASTVQQIDRALGELNASPEQPPVGDDPMSKLVAAIGRIEQRLARAEARGEVADQLARHEPDEVLDAYAEAIARGDAVTASAFERVLPTTLRRVAPHLLPRWAELNESSPTAADQAERALRSELARFTRWALSQAAELGLGHLYRQLHARYESMISG